LFNYLIEIDVAISLNWFQNNLFVLKAI